MLDLIITSYKLSINVSVTYQEYIQFPVDYTYNTYLLIRPRQTDRQTERPKDKQSVTKICCSDNSWKVHLYHIGII